MKRKHQSISETPLVADLSLIVTSTLANQRLCSSVTACDDGVASPVEYAFACAFFPCGDGIRIPKESAENVGLILRSWKRHAHFRQPNGTKNSKKYCFGCVFPEKTRTGRHRGPPPVPGREIPVPCLPVATRM